MKVLVTVEITKGFEAWSNMACELQPVAAEYGIRTLWAGSDPEETRVYAVTEATDPENMRAFMARDDVAKSARTLEQGWRPRRLFPELVNTGILMCRVRTTTKYLGLRTGLQGQPLARHCCSTDVSTIMHRPI